MLKIANSAIQKPPRLSPRQWQVLRCLIKGHSNKYIANYLKIEVVTVKMHVGIVLKKLEANNRTEAAVRGIELYIDRSVSNIDLPESKFIYSSHTAHSILSSSL